MSHFLLISTITTYHLTSISFKSRNFKEHFSITHGFLFDLNYGKITCGSFLNKIQLLIIFWSLLHLTLVAINCFKLKIRRKNLLPKSLSHFIHYVYKNNLKILENKIKSQYFKAACICDSYKIKQKKKLALS